MKNKVKKVAEIEELNISRSALNPEVIEAFERFAEYHPAQRLSKNLRSLLLEFLMYDGSSEAEYLRDLVIDLDGLFELLDVVEEKYQGIGVQA